MCKWQVLFNVVGGIMVELLGEKGHDQDAAWSEDEIGVLQRRSWRLPAEVNSKDVPWCRYDSLTVL